MGYQVEMLFFYLDNPELARERVNSRVAAGGHNIPDDVIIRRYSRGLDNFLNLYVNLCDQWGVYNNSTGIPVLIANGETDSIKEIELKHDWAKILEYAKK